MLFDSVCDEIMDDLDLEIEIDDKLKTKNSTSSLSGIPKEHNKNRTISKNDPSIKVDFNRFVKINFLDLTNVAETGEEALENTALIIVNENFERLTDVIEVIGGRAKLKESLVITGTVYVVIVSSENANLIVKIDFHGCLHPGKYD